jgi:hypothetical protein
MRVYNYEVSTAGDRRFSALVARLQDGRTIEEAYQLDVKGYRKLGDDWRLGKGKPPLNATVDTTKAYGDLWWRWAFENPRLVFELKRLSAGKRLTDRFSRPGNVSQASALQTIIDSLPEPEMDT